MLLNPTKTAPKNGKLFLLYESSDNNCEKPMLVFYASDNRYYIRYKDCNEPIDDINCCSYKGWTDLPEILNKEGYKYNIKNSDYLQLSKIYNSIFKDDRNEKFNNLFHILKDEFQRGLLQKSDIINFIENCIYDKEYQKIFLEYFQKDNKK